MSSKVYGEGASQLPSKDRAGSLMGSDEALSRRLVELLLKIEALVKAVEKDAIRAEEGK